MIRSELRQTISIISLTPQVTEIADQFAVALAPPEARSQLAGQSETFNPNELVNEFIQIQVDADVFADVLRKQTDERITEVEQSTSGLVGLDTVKNRNAYWVGLLDQLKGKKLNVLVRLSGREGQVELQNRAKALEQAREQLERVLVSIEQGKETLTAALHESGMISTAVRNPETLRPNAFTEQAALPGISTGGDFENFRNDFLFQIRPVETEIGPDDSALVEKSAALLDVVVALLLAFEIKERSELRNPLKAARLKEMLAEKLFVGYPGGGNIFQFEGGNVAVSRSELRRYLLAVQASRAAAQAA